MLIHCEATLQRDKITQCGKVKVRAPSPDGNTIGTHNYNHVLNTLTHDVDFEDRDVR